MTQIRVENLRKAFGDFVAVKGSDFTIEDGSFFVMLGPSGCGKTTTLRMVAGLELPTEGRILLDGEDVTLRRASERDIAFVFQLFALYPHMNVADNIGFPLKCQGVPREEVRKQVEEAARLLRIESLLKSKVSGLSGGDRQRVALGRAIVRRPKAFMMDEPLGALDSEMRHLMFEELRDLHDRISATTVYVTHDQLEAMSIADRIAVMNHGVVEQIGSPQEIYDAPATKFVADFVGSPPMNFLPFRGALRQGDRSVVINGSDVAVPESHEAATTEALALGVRPEHVYLADSAPLRGSIFGAEYLGSTQIVTIDTAYGRIKARMPARATVRPGETVGVGFRSESLVVFDDATGRALRSVLHERAAHG
jgi:multiple sugar transport system ATP-binding protein